VITEIEVKPKVEEQGQKSHLFDDEDSAVIWKGYTEQSTSHSRNVLGKKAFFGANKDVSDIAQNQAQDTLNNNVKDPLYPQKDPIMQKRFGNGDKKVSEEYDREYEELQKKIFRYSIKKPKRLRRILLVLSYVTNAERS
jgi:hypothetical protein